MVYLFGQDVKNGITRLQGELKRAQADGPSEVRQLLIGRDAETRCRVRAAVGLAVEQTGERGSTRETWG